jgi:hypothetical protein
MFVFLYLAAFVVGAGIIAAHGYPLQDSLFEFASALSTVGISVGITSASAPAGVLWVEILGMFLGRLEFFTIVIGVLKLFQDGADLLSAGLEARAAERSVRRNDTGANHRRQAMIASPQGLEHPDRQEGQGSSAPGQAPGAGAERARGPELQDNLQQGGRRA